MKGLTLCSVVLLSGSLLFSSCGTWTNTAKGTAIGVGGGAAVGAGIGALAGNTALGTAIGAALAPGSRGVQNSLVKWNLMCLKSSCAMLST